MRADGRPCDMLPPSPHRPRIGPRIRE